MKEELWFGLPAGTVVYDDVLPCSVSELERSFFADTAALSIEQFHIDAGDHDVALTPWAPDPSSPDVLVRTLSLLKQLAPNPMLPKECPLDKKMRLTRWREGRVLVIASTVSTQKTPFCDYFTTCEAIYVADSDAELPIPAHERAPHGAAANHGGCRFVASIAVTFVKSTVFASRIVSESVSASGVAFKAYTAAMRAVLAKAAADAKPVEAAVAAAADASMPPPESEGSAAYDSEASLSMFVPAATGVCWHRSTATARLPWPRGPSSSQPAVSKGAALWLALLCCSA